MEEFVVDILKIHYNILNKTEMKNSDKAILHSEKFCCNDNIPNSYIKTTFA